MRYLVTGGAGFIGSNFIRFLFNKYGDVAQVVNLDKLTYAGIRENLAEYEGKPNYRFQQGDIANVADVAEAYKGVDGTGVDVVVNFAAETHVDRSLMEAGTFIETDVHGVLVLLEEARKHAPNLKRFVQVSTDEVYGSIDTGSFPETDAANLGLRPSPRDYTATVVTANGKIKAAPATLDRVEVGNITVYDVRALVLPDEVLTTNLLGVSFLSRLRRYEYANGRLVLEQ